MRVCTSLRQSKSFATGLRSYNIKSLQHVKILEIVDDGIEPGWHIKNDVNMSYFL